MQYSPQFVRFLIVSNVMLIGIVLMLCLTAFDSPDNVKDFTEINVERINIIGENKKPVMVISNKKYIPGPTMNGKTYSRDVIDGRSYFSGILFFNELGDEVGSIIYAGIQKDSTRYSAVGHLSFDQWKQNQVLALDYNGNEKGQSTGLRIWDRPRDVSLNKTLDLMEAMVNAKGNSAKADSLRTVFKTLQQSGAMGTERMFIGSKNDVAQIQLKDKKGVVRARLYVRESGDATLEFLDEKGMVIKTFPE